MLPDQGKAPLRFYFITDEGASLPLLQQVRIALRAGATIVQYRHKNFSSRHFGEVRDIRKMCHANGALFVVNDDILLARAVGADGVHLGQADEPVCVARQVLGEKALIGLSVSTVEELGGADTDECDYLGTGPVFGTRSKADAKPTIGLSGLAAVVSKTDLPVVAIGGIDPSCAESCLETGARGVAVISCITRSDRPMDSARDLARAIGISAFPDELQSPWKDEFGLIQCCLQYAPPDRSDPPTLIVPPGDDAAVLREIRRPVITTDAQVEGVHFYRGWQSPRDVGYKAVVVTLSDLAASYARPLSLFVNLSLPEDVPVRLVKDIYAGLQAALESYGCLLGGGNLTAGESISLNLFAIGEASVPDYPRRSAARPGDRLCCTGRLGLARAGLLALQEKKYTFADLISRFKYPRARFDAAEVLAACGVKCVIDVSDGLAGDAAHLAEASRVTISFDWPEEFVSPQLRRFCELCPDTPQEIIYKGGEDYELLFTCTSRQLAEIQRRLPEVYCLGHCRGYDGRYLRNVPAGVNSFQHGGRP